MDRYIIGTEEGVGREIEMPSLAHEIVLSRPRHCHVTTVSLHAILTWPIRDPVLVTIFSTSCCIYTVGKCAVSTMLAQTLLGCLPVFLFRGERADREIDSKNRNQPCLTIGTHLSFTMKNFLALKKTL